jgi:transcriptional regulator with XRE-family HTH domain
MRQIGIRELARETGVSHATLSRIERGHAMDASTLILLWEWMITEDADAR